MELTALRARELRNAPTEAERLLWRALRKKQLGEKFRRQLPVGPYILDFACVERSLAIELDGGQHFESLHDQTRDAWLREQGWKVLRFWNVELFENLEGVVEKIQACLQEAQGAIS